MVSPLSPIATPVRSALLALACVAALAGCAQTPQPPLLSPQATIGRFGYSELQLQPDRWQINYTGPTRATFARPGSQSRGQGEFQARREAYDMAAWRAAQIALDKGYGGFRIIDSRSDMDSERYGHAAYDGFGPDWRWGWGYRSRCCWGGFGYPGFGYSGIDDSSYSFRVFESLTVEFVKNPKSGEFDAHQVIDELRTTYPGADSAGTVVLPPAS